MRQWTGSSLVQIMAWHLFGASHYLNWFWVIVNWTPRNKLQRNLNKNTKLFIHKKMLLKTLSAKWRPFCPGGDVLKVVGNIQHVPLFHDLASNKVKESFSWFGDNDKITYKNNLLNIKKNSAVDIQHLYCWGMIMNIDYILDMLSAFSILKTLSAKWRPFCPGGDVLKVVENIQHVPLFHDLASNKQHSAFTNSTRSFTTCLQYATEKILYIFYWVFLDLHSFVIRCFILQVFCEVWTVGQCYLLWV